MAKKLKDCFPMIREEKELLAEIRESETLRRTFQGWPEEKQRIFLDCCTGARGVKMLYDSFFKEIMNPEKNPERIEEMCIRDRFCDDCKRDRRKSYAAQRIYTGGKG